jgi:hypothetical protein
MKTLFPGYYRPSEEEFADMWQEGIFAFDANILLNIYRYTPETQKSFFDVLEKLTNRIWIPYQVAYEYQVQRLNVISAQEKAYVQIESLFDQTLRKLEGGLSSYRKHTYVDVKRLLKSIQKEFDRAKKGLQKVKAKHPNYFDSDPLRENITELFDGKIGGSYSEKELKDLYKEAEKRFSSSPPIPPGYEDAKTKDAPQKYGDAIVWFQLMDYAKQYKKPMFLITDDRKDDWWFTYEGKTIGPRPELIQEMKSIAGISFYMYDGYKFLDYAQNFFGIEGQKSAVKEAKEIREQDEVRRFGDDSVVFGESALGEGDLGGVDRIRDLISNPNYEVLARYAKELESNPMQETALRQFREVESNPAYQAAERQRRELESNPAYQAMKREEEKLESNLAYREAKRRMRELESNPSYRMMEDLRRRGLI